MNSPGLGAMTWRKSSHSGNGGECVEVGVTGVSANWRKSSHSGNGGQCVEVGVSTPVPWRKGSHSTNGGQCIEAAEMDGVVGVRDSKDPDGPVLVLAPRAWASLLAAVKAR